ncbi:LysR family transcriptional regulator [Rhizobiales bacterium]|uniref:LysR family transcriptional regulator n=1 Tax=Hongsoonwoonella zoysiae TaxID=2821844 RepID=UPI0015619498|nr:LysR family transcriptional regulator [Hongsoonwoonella zoysiae]NRG17487.1 LysR family transcriptional regulator [Hongsoonwoonella zoysiae]
MDRLHTMQVFVAVADAGNFARAGAKLNLSPPAVTRAVSSLEERLGVRLFNRTTRSLSLTEAGEDYLSECRRLLEDIEGVEQIVRGRAATASGHLRVTAPVTFGRKCTTPLLSDFLDVHPQITATLLCLDRVVDIVEEGIDIAVRIAHLPDSTLLARRVGHVRQVLVASPDYLDMAPKLETPGDLESHRTITTTALAHAGNWRLVLDGKPCTAAIRPRLDVNDAAAVITEAERGGGLVMALSYMVEDAVRAGRLKLVLDRFMPDPVPVSLVYPPTRKVSGKVRAFVDFAAPRLAERLGEMELAREV